MQDKVATDLREYYAQYDGDGSTADAIHHVLSEAILERTLPAGWRLGEERLAELFSVSRTPVREALMRLESERLASRNRRSGLVVGHLEPEQILEIYILREVLDGAAARQAAQFGAPVDIALLERINREMGQAATAGDYEGMARLNVEFHTALANASRNALLQRFVEQIHRAVRRFHRTTFSERGRARAAVREHAAIIKAIRVGDTNGAESAARHHMRLALEVRLRMETEG